MQFPRTAMRPGIATGRLQRPVRSMSPLAVAVNSALKAASAKEDYSYRCHSRGRREQKQSFDFFTWGANLLKKIGSSGVRTSESSDPILNLERPPPAEPSRAGDATPSEAASTSGRDVSQPIAVEPAVREPRGPEEELQERKKAFRHLSRLNEITHEWPAEGTPTWEDWQEAFDGVIASEEDFAKLHQSMGEATLEEDYSTAARLKEMMDDLAGDNEVSTLLESYAEAVHEEDFEKAAHLRDSGGVGLLGWWWPQSTNAENPNHILRVVPALHRYMFLAYDPNDLAQIHETESKYLIVLHKTASRIGILPKEGIGMASREELQFVPNPSKLDFDGAGMPVMELFFTRFGDDEAVEEDRAELLTQAAVLKYSEPEAEKAEADESESTLAEGDSSAVGEAAEATDKPADESAEDENEEVINVEGISLGGADADDSPIPVMHVSINPGDEPSFLEQIADATGGLDRVEVPDFAPRIQEPRVQRVPAVIQKFENDRDRFLVHILESEEQEEAAAAAASNDPTEPASPSGKDDTGADVEVQILHRHREPGKQEILSKLADLAKDKGIDLKQGVSIEVRVKGKLKDKKLDYKTMAEEIVKDSGSFLDSGTVADILKEVFDKVKSGKAGGKDTGAGLTGSISYKRIPIDKQRTDPFTGIYAGSFGGHGPEILQLQRSRGQDGKEYCEATKLTGDENVPAGNVSFRAAVGIKNRASGYGFYPPELNVTARYKGQGRIAEVGYKNASWVDGELIQFGGGHNEFAKGAELGFLWNLGGEQKHLSLLHRLSLDDPLTELLDAAEELL